MNSKNKTVILTMAMAVAFAVTGCGSKQSADTSPAVSSSSETNIIKSREGKSLSAFSS